MTKISCSELQNQACEGKVKKREKRLLPKGLPPPPCIATKFWYYGLCLLVLWTSFFPQTKCICLSKRVKIVKKHTNTAKTTHLTPSLHTHNTCPAIAVSSIIKTKSPQSPSSLQLKEKMKGGSQEEEIFYLTNQKEGNSSFFQLFSLQSFATSL